MSKAPNLKTYYVQKPGWVAGTWMAKDTPVKMTAAQAKYETNLALTKPKATKDDAAK